MTYYGPILVELQSDLKNLESFLFFGSLNSQSFRIMVSTFK